MNFPDHMKVILESADESLVHEERINLAKMLLEFSEVFAKDDLDLGCFKEIKDSIPTGDAQPIRQRLRKTALGFEGEEQAHLSKMLDVRIIEPSKSEWAFAPVLV